MSRLANPRPQYFDDAGDPLVSGKAFFYDSGTSTLKTTYADINLTVVNTNPVILTASGRLPNVFFEGSARMVLTSSADVQLWDLDPVGDSDLTGPFTQWSAIVTYQQFAIVQASDSQYYRSLQNANLGQDPTTKPAFWEQIDFVRVWNTNVLYSIGEYAKASNNQLYRSLTNNNQGNDPTTDTVNWGSPVTSTVLGLSDGGRQTTNFTATANSRYRVSSAADTVTAPLNPSEGDVVLLEVETRSSTLTWGRNGQNVVGVSEDGTINGSFFGARLLTFTTGSGWV